MTVRRPSVRNRRLSSAASQKFRIDETGPRSAKARRGPRCFQGSPSSPSRPGEFHPEPLTEPDVRLSPHPARATQRRLAPSGETAGFLRSPVDPTNTVSDPPPSLHGHYPASSLLWGGPRLTGPSVLSAS